MKKPPHSHIKILCVVGARPNFIKIAPIIDAFKKFPDKIEYRLVHTEQHYDKAMSHLFFDDLKIPKPHYTLGVGSGSHAWQTAEIMKRFEPIVLKYNPEFVLVVGDVNSTIAAGLVAKKLGKKLIHVEAGLRSFDINMPEEINRMLTDRISDVLFTTEKNAEKNLIKEGVEKNRIFFVGNVMIDSLLKNKQKAEKNKYHEKIGLKNKNYILLTLHRPSNVDNKENLKQLIETVNSIAEKTPVVFPIHPRTKNKMKEFHLTDAIHKNILLQNPLGYLEFLNLMAHAGCVLTDSGGIQEETTILRVPCVTLRESTERPITVECGYNTLVGHDKTMILKTVKKILEKTKKRSGKIPELWDGKAAERIVKILVKMTTPKITFKKYRNE